MKALLIPIDGPARVTELPGGGGTRFMNSIKALIGTDCAERIRVTTRWEAWLDENGASAGRQVNQAATGLAQSFGWQLGLAGPVVIVGLDQNTDPAALSPDQIDAILEKIRTPAALHPPCRRGRCRRGPVRRDSSGRQLNRYGPGRRYTRHETRKTTRPGGACHRLRCTTVCLPPKTVAILQKMMPGTSTH